MNDLLERLLARGGKSSQSVFDGKLGVEMFDGYTGRLSGSGAEVRLRVEHDDLVHLVTPVSESPEPAEAMWRNHALPGNLRFARLSQATWLLADTQVDGAAHLGATFREFKRGLASALGRETQADEAVPAAAAKANIEAAVAGLNWDEDRLVKRDDGWEFRLRARGEMQAVRAAIGKRADLHLFVPILAAEPGNRDILARAALQLNAELRLARYALAGDELLAEARLHLGILGPPWLAAAARAVAVAARHARRLRLLAECPQVQDWYGRLFPFRGNDRRD
jgi:hypothetical protein